MKVSFFVDSDSGDIRLVRYFSVARCARMTCAWEFGVQSPPKAREV